MSGIPGDHYTRLQEARTATIVPLRMEAAHRAPRAQAPAPRPDSREGLQFIDDTFIATHRLALKIPPVVTGAVTATGMWLVSRTLPTFAFAPLRVVAVGTGIAGTVTTGLAVLSFRRAHTTVNPMKPSSTSFLVTPGIYRFTRNPMYLGLLFVLVGWALYLPNALSFLFLPAFFLYINRF